MSSVNLKCPVCRKALGASEHGIAAKQLEKTVLEKCRIQLRKNKLESATMIAKLKHSQRGLLQAMAKKHKSEKKSLQKRLVEQTKKSRESQKREISQLRRNYQAQLEHVRDFYGTQNAALQNELKASFDGQLESMKKNYESLASSNQRQLELLQKYIEEHVVGELRQKVRQLQEDKMSADMRLSEIVRQLDERNAEVVSLKERLNRTNTMVHTDFGQAQAQSEIQDTGNTQEEILKMVKEVADQQREMSELRELEEDGHIDKDGEEVEEEKKHTFWGSKSSKKFGLF